MDLTKRTFVKDIVEELSNENVAVFAGAGLSAPAGFVNWAQLLEPIAEELGLDTSKERDLVSLAQYHCNDNSANRSKLNQLLIEEFSKDAQSTETHKILSRLPIRDYWTTNYDKLIEKTLIDYGRKPDVKHTVEQLAHTKPRRDAVIYKMHGDVDHPSDAILTKDDYESYHVEMQPFLSALSGDLVSKTFIFIGFSFTDPNLDYILSRVRLSYNKNQRRHYCFQKKVSQNINESDVEFEYRERKQEYFINDLKRFNIRTILIDDYDEIPELLSTIERKHNSKSVFISGAAHDFGDWSKECAEQFTHDLSKNLIKKQFRIVSGFGLGIGSAVISGALSEIYMNSNNHSDDQLILKPFPQSVMPDQDKKELWSKYREQMLSYSGVSIFLFGNKIVDGKVIPSNGMQEEFDIAKDKGLFLLPIGCTGYVAQELWEKVNADFDSFNKDCSDEIKRLFSTLGSSDSDRSKVIETTVEIVSKLTK
ncbi:SIR2 family protein [Thalassotalea sp. G20_0]|uniref:SIR2 family protein n=1 Tax=Thalassotalea sp. G20_0 TaxID=2821093 RepID=UPI001ADC3E7B|nr:SIR2 family protein [Thalassotalea sp. G20_0]